MAGSRQAPDRTNQKDRTRKALSDAAADMMRRGHQPTVAEAAEAAGVHRATAYRYFPTAKSLLAEGAMAAVDIDPDKVFASANPDDPVALLDTSVTAVCELMFGEESLFRQNLLVALEGWFARQGGDAEAEIPTRSTRRFTWIDRALEPLGGTLDPALLRRLRYGLALTFGAEAVIVTRDVCRLDVDEATDVMRWASASLLRSAMAQGRSARAVGAEAGDPDGDPDVCPDPASGPRDSGDREGGVREGEASDGGPG